jgi:hypothetical protein
MGYGSTLFNLQSSTTEAQHCCDAPARHGSSVWRMSDSRAENSSV